MERSELVAIRAYEPDDKNFIYATWLEGLYYGNSWFGDIPADIYFAKYQKVLDLILSFPDTIVKVACLEDTPDVILAYSVSGPGDILHWVHCKKSWRNIGIAKSIVSPSVKVVTHLTKAGRGIMRKHPKIVFNPFLT